MIRVGTAGWNVPKTVAALFGAAGCHLTRYASVMTCGEINSSFYRPHRVSTYARWATETPHGFRFAAKVPKTITHEARLIGIGRPMDAFLAEVTGLGDKLGVLLVQLPPSLALDRRSARAFFTRLRARFDGAIVCEPRHATWFDDAADRLMQDLRVGRAAADPALSTRAAEPGGWLGPDGDGRGAVLYYRWHGSPRMYWSAYEEPWLRERAAALSRWPADAERWCVFDNTGGGHALANALALKDMLRA